jgi:hypothetical protein
MEEVLDRCCYGPGSVRYRDASCCCQSHTYLSLEVPIKVESDLPSIDPLTSACHVYFKDPKISVHLSCMVPMLAVILWS